VVALAVGNTVHARTLEIGWWRPEFGTISTSSAIWRSRRPRR